MTDADQCACGHARSLHNTRTGECVALPCDKPLSWWCGCKQFTPPKDDDQ